MPWMAVASSGMCISGLSLRVLTISSLARGCVIIGQHADSTGAPSAVQAALDGGKTAYSVGYNVDMLSVAPAAALTSAQNARLSNVSRIVSPFFGIHKGP